MVRKRNPATGRSRDGGKYVRLEEWLLQSEAYRSLSCYARALYVELKRRFNGSNNGEIHMSLREAATACGCSDKPMRQAILELQKKGFIIVKTPGGFSRKTRHATEWVLTEYAVGNAFATKTFMRWKPALNSDARKKSRCTERRVTVYPEPQQDPENAPNRLDGAPSVQREASISPADGVPSVRTYNIPYTPPSKADPDTAAPGLPNLKGQGRSAASGTDTWLPAGGTPAITNLLNGKAHRHG